MRIRFIICLNEEIRINILQRKIIYLYTEIILLLTYSQIFRWKSKDEQR